MRNARTGASQQWHPPGYSNENVMARVPHTCLLAILVVGALTAAAHEAQADALIVTRAMQASTIVEIFIDSSEIRVEFEIGVVDLPAFANVLPDELCKKVAGDSRPLDERLQTFFATDWVIQGDGQPLRGRVEQLIPGKRVVRDAVTGEALADPPASAEVVMRLTVRYPLRTAGPARSGTHSPQSLTIHRPRHRPTANIGFVCYHNNLPINDFRYLPGEVRLDLDWVDPWYSRFHNPNLRRQFDAPLAAYLYIEPYEVRQEIIIRPRDLQTWLDLGLPDDGVLPVDQQETLKQRVADFLADKNPVSIDGQPAQGRLDRIHFIYRTLRTTGIIEPPVDLDMTSALLGIIFVYPTEKLPTKVSMKWELFSPKIQSVPSVAADEAGGLPDVVTPEDPLLTWQNYLTHPTNPRMLTVPSPPAQRQWSVPLLSVCCGGLAMGSLLLRARQRKSAGDGSRTTSVVALAALVAAFLSLPIARVPIPIPLPPQHLASTSQQILASLLTNVYRSFDHHDESVIYDRLAQSIAGDLLADVYLETRRSIEVKNQGGLRISVKEVEVTELHAIARQAAEATFRCRWRVAGWIGHWGHIHARTNEHLAQITIAAREEVWKITALEMLDQRPGEQPPAPGQTEDGA